MSVRKMRRQSQRVDDPETLVRWLAEARVGRLGTVDGAGYPAIKPVCFAYAGGKIYVHSATEGEKLDDIRRDPRVCFEVDRLFAITPPLVRGCQTHAFYQSVIVRGRARILDAGDRQEKEQALRLLVAKYAPDFAATPLKGVENTAVIEIAVEEMDGKEDFGESWPADRKLQIAKLLYREEGLAAAETIARLGLAVAEVLAGEEERETS